MCYTNQTFKINDLASKVCFPLLTTGCFSDAASALFKCSLIEAIFHFKKKHFSGVDSMMAECVNADGRREK